MPPLPAFVKFLKICEKSKNHFGDALYTILSSGQIGLLKKINSCHEPGG